MRPEDPLVFLANWLLKNKKSVKSIEDLLVNKMEEKLKKEMEEKQKEKERQMGDEEWEEGEELDLNENVEDKVAREREEYDNATKNSVTYSMDDNIDLNMTVKFVDGDEIIADSSLVKGGILEACQQFEEFVAARIASS